MDYSEFQDDKPGDNLLAQLSAAADYQKQLQDEIAEMETELGRKKQELYLHSTKTLPDLLDAANMKTFSTKDGATVEMKDDIKASVTKTNMAAACLWLRENGFGALIKNQVIAEFGMGEDEKAAEALVTLETAHLGHVKQQETIHSGALTAWVKRKLEDDPDINLPIDVLGIKHQQMAVVK